MSEKFDRLIELLQGVFELDKAGLDFGIYRIINIRKAEIQKFLTEKLPKMMTGALSPLAVDNHELCARKAEIEKICAEAGVPIEKSKLSGEYAAIGKTLALPWDISSLEAESYSHLYHFFSRYYEEGDFISKRRYKEGVYAIPYGGEEVKLYWANQDQYYIKTSENFKDYSFKDGGKTVHFRIMEASSEQNNNKETGNAKREFMLWRPTQERPDIKPIEENAGGAELTIRFVYDIPPEKKKWSEENYKTISDVINAHFTRWLSLLAPPPPDLCRSQKVKNPAPKTS